MVSVEQGRTDGRADGRGAAGVRGPRRQVARAGSCGRAEAAGRASCVGEDGVPHGQPRPGHARVAEQTGWGFGGHVGVGAGGTRTGLGEYLEGLSPTSSVPPPSHSCRPPLVR